MPPSTQSCTAIHKKRRFSLRENKSTVAFENPDRKVIHEITVDGCAIIEGPRCDFLVNVPKDEKSIFVELKGSDIQRAIEQLSSSQEQLLSETNKNIIWIVSSTRCPLTSTDVQNLALRVRKKMKATLLVRNTPVEYSL